MELKTNSREPWGMAFVLAGLWALLAVLPATSGVFLTQRNLANLMMQVSPLAVIAVGMTLVIIIRGIDLSVGAGVALTGVVAAMLQIDHGMPAWIAIAAALGVGALIGAWQGLWVARFGIPAFVVTLGGFYAYRGLGLVLSDSRGLAPMGEDFSIMVADVPRSVSLALIAILAAAGVAGTLASAARRARLGLAPMPRSAIAFRVAAIAAVAATLSAVFWTRGLPVPVLCAGAVVLLGVFLTEKTRFGRHIYAVGGNPQAARLAGISVEKTTMWVFVIIGVLTALGGILLCARTNGVTPGNAGHLLELDVITAVVIGGTSLMGGRGSIIGSLLGALVFGTLANSMNLLEINSNWQLILKGLILLSAVCVDVLTKRKQS